MKKMYILGLIPLFVGVSLFCTNTKIQAQTDDSILSRQTILFKDSGSNYFEKESITFEDTFLILPERTKLISEKGKSFKDIYMTTYPVACEEFPTGMGKCILLSDKISLGEFKIQYFPKKDFSLIIYSSEAVLFTQRADGFYVGNKRITEFITKIVRFPSK